MRPRWWRESGYVNPVVLVVQALYGHPLAGAAFSDMLAEWLEAHGWRRLLDCGEQSLYARWMTIGLVTHLVLLALLDRRPRLVYLFLTLSLAPRRKWPFA